MKNKPGLGKLVILLAVLLLTGNPSLVHAAGKVPDLTKTGSISMTLNDKKNHRTVTGGEITLYQVASAVSEEGSYRYEYVNGFEGCQLSLENPEDSELAGKLEKNLSDSTKGITKEIDAKGHVGYTDLSAGLYLLVQTKASDGYEKIESFLVSVPFKIEDEWVYDVEASPKMETITTVKPHVPKPGTSKPDTPASDTPKTSTKSEEVGNRLPQTGQLDWPVPILSIAGLLLFSAGWMLRRSERDS